MKTQSRSSWGSCRPAAGVMVAGSSRAQRGARPDLSVLGRVRTRYLQGINNALPAQGCRHLHSLFSGQYSNAFLRRGHGDISATSLPDQVSTKPPAPGAGPPVPLPGSGVPGSPRTHSRPGAVGRQTSPAWQGQIWLMLKARPPGGTWQLWSSASRRWHTRSPCCRAQQPPAPQSSSRWHRAPGGAKSGVRGGGTPPPTHIQPIPRLGDWDGAAGTGNNGAGGPQHPLAYHHLGVTPEVSAHPMSIVSPSSHG